MDDGAPSLEVGFAIDPGESFNGLVQLQNLMDSTEYKAVASAKKIEQATAGMVNVSGATAGITAFGNAATRELNAVARETARAEKSGEALSRQLDRQINTFGMTRAAAAALAAEERGLTELAERLRAQEAQLTAMHEQSAAAKRNEAASAALLAKEHADLAAMVRGSQAAQLADAAAAERLRASTDPLYAATRRLNDEIAESTRLYHAGVTAPAEYARQQDVLVARLREVERAHDAASGSIGRMGGAARLSRGDMLNLGYQMNDIVVSLTSGQKPFMVFAQQGAQIGQIAASSGVGLRGMAAAVGGLLAPFAPVIAAVAAAGAGFLLFDRAVSKGVDTKAMIDGLGLTRAEIKRLENTSVSTGDVVKATFQVMAQRVGLDLSNLGKWFSDAMDLMTKIGRVSLSALYASFVGTFRAIGAIVKGVFEGKSIGAILADVNGSYKDAFNEADGALKKFGEDVTKQISSNKLADLRKQAAEIKKDRPAKTDRHAEQLARESEAVEAQIRNLYALADAYGVSGAAALIAEARVKAESKAIKQRADVEAAVEREIRLAVAERVKEAAGGTADMRQQAAIQQQVNDAVAAGLVPASQASDMMRDRVEDLKLAAALEAALTVKGKEGIAAVEAARNALDKQREARERLTQTETEARRLQAMDAGKKRIEEMELELQLIGATDAARVKALATLRATQDAGSEGWTGQKGADFVAQQVKIADLDLQRQLRADAYNESLRHQADMLDIIADNVSRAAQGIADAFGDAGRALGGLASSFADFVADQERMNRLKDDELTKNAAIKNDAVRTRREREINDKYALRSLTDQVSLYGDLASSAKGFFEEGSKGYKALQTAEQAFRAVEFALSVRAMAQDAAETASSLAKSGLRTAANAVEAVVKAISSLPFPLNLVAGAATAAAIASLGVSIAGSFGGGGRVAPSNRGTGTVLGDREAKSESITNAIDQLASIDTIMLGYSRQMAASLRSIEGQIGGLASLVVRTGDINASAGVTEGFKPNLIGKLLNPIPLIGGLLSSLFGSRYDVIGSGLFGRPQSLGSVRESGFDASYFSDIQRTKKFLGIVTGRSQYTQFGEADAALEQQFTLLLRQFNDAIVAAAGPLGMATQAIQDRLNNFVVDIGKIDLQGLTGEQIEEKLTAIFGAAADNMANAAFPGMSQFQKVGEGAFETLVRVASTVEAVSGTLDLLGQSAQGMGVAAKLGLADQFEALSDLTSAADAYFQSFYSQEEQAVARTAQMSRVFTSLNLTMPGTLAAFRQLVEAQDLTTTAGQATYATLLQLAPAFAELQSAMAGAKSAADIASERQDLERQLLELRGDTSALRALELAKLDTSNRALQEQIWAIQDAQEAARAADELRQAWSSVGDSIRSEIERIRGLAGINTDGGFASIMSRFNAANMAARGGDMEAARSLPGLSQALLTSAAENARSQQELDRVRAQTAAELEATNALINRLGLNSATTSDAALLAASQTNQETGTPSNDNATDTVSAAIDELRAEVAAMRAENNAGNAAIASGTNKTSAILENVTTVTGGDSIATRSLAS